MLTPAKQVGKILNNVLFFRNGLGYFELSSHSSIVATSKSLNVNALQSRTKHFRFTPTPAGIFDGHPAFSLTRKWADCFKLNPVFSANVVNGRDTRTRSGQAVKMVAAAMGVTRKM